jgi:YVTN family beta-propeller protein
VATNIPGTQIPVGTRPYRVAVTPDGTTAYVTNSGDNTVTPIAVTTNIPGTPIPVGNSPAGIAITRTSTPTPTPAPTPAPRPTPAPITVTTTTLNVIQVPLPLGLGGFAIPIAHVAPLNATGTVQFRDGSTDLGTPLPVAGGVAVGRISLLSRGTHSLSAVFTPTNPAKFTLSTSNTVTFTF